MKQIIPVLLLILLSFPPASAFSINISRQGIRIDPSINPDSRLWGLDLAQERISLAFTRQEAKRVEKRQEIANERAQEALQMALENKIEARQRAEDRKMEQLQAINEANCQASSLFISAPFTLSPSVVKVGDALLITGAITNTGTCSEIPVKIDVSLYREVLGAYLPFHSFTFWDEPSKITPGQTLEIHEIAPVPDNLGGLPVLPGTYRIKVSVEGLTEQEVVVAVVE